MITTSITDVLHRNHSFLRLYFFWIFLFFVGQLAIVGCGGSDDDGVGAQTPGTTINTPPVANWQNVTTAGGAAKKIVLTGSDEDKDMLTYIIVSQPANGALSGTGPDVTYTPNPGFTGSDTFTFKVNDSKDDSAAATVSITVSSDGTPVNTPPVANSQNVTAAEGAAKNIILTGSDEDKDVLTYLIASQPANGVLSGTRPNVTYTPKTGFIGTDSFTFIVNDGQEVSAAATITITVAAAVNEAPQILSQAKADPRWLQPGGTTTLSVAAQDPEGQELTYRWTLLDGPTATLQTPDDSSSDVQLNLVGIYEFEVTITDGTNTVSSSVQVMVSTNQAPIIDSLTAGSMTVEVGLVTTLTVVARDPNDEPLTYAWNEIRGPGRIIFSEKESSHTNAIFTVAGTYDVQVHVNNGDLTTTDSLTITVTAPPADELVVRIITPFDGADIVSSSEALTVTALVTGPNHIKNVTLLVDNVSARERILTSGPYTWTLDSLEVGSHTLAVRAVEEVDGVNHMTRNEITINLVDPGNRAPVAEDQSIVTTEGLAQNITLTAADVGNHSLTFSVTGAPSHGSLSGAAPAVTYTPQTGFTGTDSFAFEVYDGELTSTGTVTVIVTSEGTNTYLISSQAVFDQYRQETFGPGDYILFKRGETFIGMFEPAGDGTADAPIRIDTYGTGSRPVIDNQGVRHDRGITSSGFGGSSNPFPDGRISAGLFLHNLSYWEVDGLEITNNDGTENYQTSHGILYLGDRAATNHRFKHIHINNCYVHDIGYWPADNDTTAGAGSSTKFIGGIWAYLDGLSGSDATLDGWHVTGNCVERVSGTAMANQSDNGVVDEVTKTGSGLWEDTYYADNKIHTIGRNAIVVRDSRNPIVERNTVAYSSRTETGNSIFNFTTIGCIMQYNEVYGNTGGNTERGAVDADYNSVDTLIQYNYSHDNGWFCALMKKENNGIVVRYNLSVNDRKAAYNYGFNRQYKAEDIHVYNNTHFFCEDQNIDDLQVFCNDSLPGNSTFENNIFHFGLRGRWSDPTDLEDLDPNREGRGTDFENNVYVNIPPHVSDESPQTADPLFVNPGDTPTNIDLTTMQELKGYRLSESSPYLDGATEIPDTAEKNILGEPIDPNRYGAF